MSPQNDDEGELTGKFYYVLDEHFPELSMGDKAEIALELFNAMKKWAVKEDLTLPQQTYDPDRSYRLHDDGDMTAEVDVMRIIRPGEEGWDGTWPKETIQD